MESTFAAQGSMRWGPFDIYAAVGLKPKKER
jgi:hypothetical protein